MSEPRLLQNYQNESCGHSEAKRFNNDAQRALQGTLLAFTASTSIAVCGSRLDRMVPWCSWQQSEHALLHVSALVGCLHHWPAPAYSLGDPSLHRRTGISAACAAGSRNDSAPARSWPARSWKTRKETGVSSLQPRCPSRRVPCGNAGGPGIRPGLSQAGQGGNHILELYKARSTPPWEVACGHAAKRNQFFHRNSAT